MRYSATVLPIRNPLVALACALAFAASPAFAQAVPEKAAPRGGHSVKNDILDHRVMAQAHEAAAKCLESGKPEKDCHAQLAKDCRGVGIGKVCGMKHKH